MKRRSLPTPPPVAHAHVGIAVACLLRTINVDARTVPDRLNRRADNHAVRLTSWRLPCARFPRLRPFADDAATERSIAVPPETVKRPPAMMAKMPKSSLASGRRLRQNAARDD